MDIWNKEAAQKAMLLFGRRRKGAGVELGADACELAQEVVDQLILQTTLVLLEAAFVEEETDFGAPSLTLASHPLFQRGLSSPRDSENRYWAECAGCWAWSFGSDLLSGNWTKIEM